MLQTLPLGDSAIENQSLIQPASPNFATSKVPFTSLYLTLQGWDWLILIIGILTCLSFSILGISMSLSLGQLIDAEEDHDSDEDDFYDKVDSIARNLFMIGAVIFLCGWLSILSFVYLGNRIGSRWRKSYYSCMIYKSPMWYDENPMYKPELFERECRYIEKAVGEKVFLLMSSVTFFIASWILALSYCLQIGLIAFGMIPLQLIAAGMIDFYMLESERRKNVAYSSAKFISEEAILNRKIVYANTAQDYVVDSYGEKLKDTSSMNTFVGVLSGFRWSLFFTVLFAFTGFIFWAGSEMIKNDTSNWSSGDEIEAHDILIVFFSITLSSFYLGNALPTLKTIRKARSVAFKISQVLNSQYLPVGSSSADSIEGKICFNNVTFYYPGSPSSPALYDICFTLKPKEAIGIIGHPESGKSTIISLLQRFYQPTSGSILIDDKDYLEYDLSSLRSHFGVVLQNPLLFKGSILQNLKIGNETASDEKCIEFARKSGAHELVLQLAAEMERKRRGIFVEVKDLTELQIWDIYKSFDVGVGGSNIDDTLRLRIAFTRVALKDAKIVIIDETFDSSNKCSVSIYKVIQDIIQDKTAILATQRIRCIKNMQRILVLENGRLVEEGTHSELFNNKNAYWKISTATLRVKSFSKLMGVSVRETAQAYDKKLQLRDGKLKDIRTQTYSTSIIWRVQKQAFELWYLIIPAVICAAISGCIFPLFGYFFAKDVNSITQESGEDMVEETFERLIYLLIGSGVTLVMLLALSWALAIATSQTTSYTRMQVLSSILKSDQAFFDRLTNSTESLSYRLKSECERMNDIGGYALAVLFLATSSLVYGLCLGFSYDAALSAMILLLLPVIIIVCSKGYRLGNFGISELYHDEFEKFPQDVMGNIKPVHSFNRESHFIIKYDNILKNRNSAVMKSAAVNGFIFALSFLVIFYTVAICLLYGAGLVKDGASDIEDINVSFFSMFLSTWCFFIVGAFSLDLQAGLKSSKNVFEIIDNKSKIEQTKDMRLLTDLEGRISLQNLIFSYPDRPKNPVLKGLSLDIKPCSVYGITGNKGSGKSTLANLLLRFYDPQQGVITIDDRDLKVYNINFLRNSIGWSVTDPIIFTGTIVDNLKFNKPEVSLDEVKEAIIAAEASDFLPSDVLYQSITHSFFTPQQRQRIGLARALVRKPKIVILDEALTYQDIAYSSRILSRLKNSEVTTIFITANPKTLSLCDSIAILELGHCIEKGTHQELIEEDGYYKKLITGL
jgi:ATP-binding cassette subfamily B (MDR/TAP) protein 1